MFELPNLIPTASQARVGLLSCGTIHTSSRQWKINTDRSDCTQATFGMCGGAEVN